MTVIQKTIRVPENHRITLDIPGDVPAGGMADVVVTIAVPREEPPAKPAEMKKRIGILSGRLHVPDDFDAPLPDDVLRSFEGEE